jgi:hypothetical protein
MLAVVAAAAVTLALGARLLLQARSAAVPGPPDTTLISAQERAAGLRFAPSVAAPDRAWILAAIGHARPEARRLIAEVDGMVELRTHRGDPLGVTDSTIGRRRASFVIDLDVASLDGRRRVDRDVVVLHELGHAIDGALVSRALGDELDAEIPRAGYCGAAPEGGTGSCAAPAERFADTFAKWALRGGVSVVGAGYGVAVPASLESWGEPLRALADRLPATGDPAPSATIG